MAVYTALSESDVAQFLQGFGLTRLLQLRATDSGIENTNYFVDAQDANGQQHPLVLTLFERGEPEALPYFIELTTYLSHCRLPVPAPYRDLRQQALHHVQGKACLLVPRFPGHHPIKPSLLQCAAIGTALARMHQASSGFSLRRDNDRGAAWRLRVLQKLQAVMPTSQWQLLQKYVTEWQQQLPALTQLPSGITHGDLFHDNALFEGDVLTGIIDFYNACHDIFIYDLAVLVNDWCSDVHFSLDPARVQAVVTGYESVRILSAQEQFFWSAMLRYGALRFWLSRLENWYFPTANLGVIQKDPEPMRLLLLARVQ